MMYAGIVHSITYFYTEWVVAFTNMPMDTLMEVMKKNQEIRVITGTRMMSKMKAAKRISTSRQHLFM